MLQIYILHVQNWLKTETNNKKKTESHKNQTYYEATQPTQLTKFNQDNLTKYSYIPILHPTSISLLQ